jgi:hypothetical protein
MNMGNYLSDPLWLLGAFGWIVGIVSGFLQVKSYLGQRKYENAHKMILEQAERDWKGKYTQEQIDSMVQELRRLEASINRDIPRKARRVFLEDQLSSLKDDLVRNYSRYNELVAELSLVDDRLPDQIQRTVETSIMPSYIANKRETKQLQWLLITAIFLIVFLNWDFLVGLIPLDWSIGSYEDAYPMSWMIIYFFFVVIMAFLINQIFIGTWIKKHVRDLIANIHTGTKKKSLKEEMLSTAKLSIAAILIMALMLSPSLYMSFTQDKAKTITGDSTYANAFLAMPLSSVPLAVWCAVPPSLGLILFYDFVAKARGRIARSSISEEHKQL